MLWPPRTVRQRLTGYFVASCILINRMSTRNFCRRVICYLYQEGIAPAAARRYAPADGSSTVAYRFAANQATMDPKIAADLRPSADGSAVRTSLVVAGGGYAAGIHRAYSPGRQLCHGTDRRTDRAIPK